MVQAVSCYLLQDPSMDILAPHHTAPIRSGYPTDPSRET